MRLALRDVGNKNTLPSQGLAFYGDRKGTRMNEQTKQR
jgi:hypothetical protein